MWEQTLGLFYTTSYLILFNIFLCNGSHAFCYFRNFLLNSVYKIRTIIIQCIYIYIKTWENNIVSKRPAYLLKYDTNQRRIKVVRPFLSSCLGKIIQHDTYRYRLTKFMKIYYFCLCIWNKDIEYNSLHGKSQYFNISSHLLIASQKEFIFSKYYLQICSFNEKSKLYITRSLQYQIQVNTCLCPSYDWFIAMLAALCCSKTARMRDPGW